MEALVAFLLLFAVVVAAGVGFWAMRRSVVLTRRLHPEQRESERKAARVLIPLLIVAAGLGVVAGTGGVGLIVVIALMGAVLLLDAILLPVVRYRRARRQHEPPST